MVGMYPLGPVVEGAGLNITVMSYCGVVYFGLTGCRETVPDLADLPEMITQGLDELLEIVRAEKMARAGTSAGPPAGAGGGAGTAPGRASATPAGHAALVERSRGALMDAPG